MTSDARVVPRLGVLVVGVCVLGSTGCDISVRSFAGAVIQMAITGAAPSAPNQHFEMWARTEFDDVVRLDTKYDVADPIDPQKTDPLRPFGFIVRNAIAMADPCMIDQAGNLLITAAAYPGNTNVNGVTQTPEEQAAQVRARVAQLTSTSNCDGAVPPHCGTQPSDLLATVPFDPNTAPVPVIADDADAPTRLAACKAYWASSPLAYSPNPLQLSLPRHGTVTGFLNYVTQVPVAGFNAMRTETSFDLHNIREFFLTLEDQSADDLAQTPPRDGVDPLARGPVFLQGYPTRGGRNVLSFNLTGPTASGTAAILVDLDTDTSGF